MVIHWQKMERPDLSCPLAIHCPFRRDPIYRVRGVGWGNTLASRDLLLPCPDMLMKFPSSVIHAGDEPPKGARWAYLFRGLGHRGTFRKGSDMYP